MEEEGSGRSKEAEGINKRYAGQSKKEEERTGNGKGKNQIRKVKA